MNKTYKMEWDDWQGRQLSLFVYDIETESSDVVTMEPGDVPLVVEQTDRDEMMKPLRYTTARISVISSFQDLIELTGDNRYRVVVKRGNDVVWQGWLTSDVLDQPFQTAEDEISYNAVDDLGHMSAVNLTDTATSLTLRGIFQQGIDSFRGKGAEYGTQYIYVGNGFPIVTSVDNTLDIITNIQEWKYKDDEGKIVTAPLDDILKEMMKLMGCTLFSDGMDWYIVSPVDTQLSGGVEMDGSLSFAGVIFSDFTVRQFYSLKPMGSHKLTIFNPVNHVSMVSGGDEIGSILPEISSKKLKFLKAIDPEFKYSGDQNDQTATQIGWKALQYVSPAGEDGEIQLFRYAANAQQSSQTQIVLGDEVSENISYTPYPEGKNIFWRVGACFLREDYYDTVSTIDEGSGDAFDKKNYDFHERLYILTAEVVASGYDVRCYKNTIQHIQTEWTDYDKYVKEVMDTALMTWNKPMVTLRKRDGFTADSGGLCISCEIWRGWNYTSSYQNIPQKMKGPLLVNKSGGLCIIVCLLRIGDQYWDGSQFIQTPCQFYMIASINGNTSNTEFSVINNTKELTQNYKCNGYSIPVTNLISGDVELNIYFVGQFTAIRDSSTNYYSGTLADTGMLNIIKDFKVEYCPPLGEDFEEEKSESSRKSMNAGGIGDFNITTRLCSNDVKADNTGTLYLGSGKLGEMTAVDIQNAAVPEKITFERAKRLYQNNQELIELTIEITSNATPKERLTFDGNVYVLHMVKNYDITTGIATIIYLKRV